MKQENEFFVFDSSIWVELERDNKRIRKLLEPIIEQDLVVMVDLIAAEVLRGAKSEREYNLLLDYFLAFPTLSAKWTKVAKIGHTLARKGFSPPLADIYIAEAVRDFGCTLITKDTHFKIIKSVVSFNCRFL